MKEAKPIKTLTKDMAPFEATVTDSLFFKYTIEDTSDLENMLLLLNVSKRKDLQIYIHSRCYPSDLFREHEYALGDIPEHVIRAMFQNYYMKEMYHDANPFHYVSSIDSVLYYPHFNHTNQDLFNPEHREMLDSARVAKYTTWSPQTGPDLSFVTPYNLAEEPEDRIDLVFTAAMWQYRKPEVHIGVFNSRRDRQPVTFDIRMREVSCYDCLSDELRVRNEVFNFVHEGTDAHLTSDTERAEKDLHWQTELIYGEVLFQHFIPTLEFAKPQPGEVFWDLGCGGGRPLITASLAFPSLKACKGLELLEKLSLLAKQIASKLHAECDRRELTYSPVEIHQGDML